MQAARERNRVLRELAERKKHLFMQSFVGRDLDAITLTHSDGKQTEALSDNYLKLFVIGSCLPNENVRVHVQSFDGHALVGAPSSLD